MSQATLILEQAIAHHRRGELDAAEKLYRELIALAPNHADAHHLLGMAAFQRGQTSPAIEHFQRAVAADGGQAPFRHHLGVALGAAGRHAEAAAQLWQAVTLDPRSASARNDLGTALAACGEMASAEQSLREAIRLDPNLAEAYNNLGNLLSNTGRFAEALAPLETALCLRPQAAQVHFNLGNAHAGLAHWGDAERAYRQALAHQPDLAAAHRNLGVALFQQKRHAAAAECHRAALALDPDDAAAHTALGAALQNLDENDAAKGSYARALALRPDDPVALANSGTLLLNDGSYEEAERLLSAATSHDGTLVEAHFRLGQCRQRQGKLDAAIDAYRAAIALDSDHADARYNLASVHLLRGELAAGWDEYDWRLRASHARRPCPRLLPTGAPLRGRRVLVCAEGGLGDTLQFIRYVSRLVDEGAEVTIEVPENLMPLLAASGFGPLVAIGQSGKFAADGELPMLSLPRYFGTTLDTIPHDVPYLTADVELVAYWRDRLQACGGLKVGIVWHGARFWSTDERSIPLAALAPLAAVDGVTLVSLQKYDEKNQLQQWGERLRIVDFSEELDRQAAFVDTAAVIEGLDLVITCDTATAHLAGALGARVWVALAQVPEWRWMLDRADSPWYPTMRLFRQSRRGDWSGVFDPMAIELSKLAARGSARDKPLP